MLNYGLLATNMIEIQLRIQMKPDCLEAIPFYEQPGGIRVWLLERPPEVEVYRRRL